MVIRELITRWGFDIDDKPIKAAEQSIDDLKNTLKVVGAAAIAAGGTLFGFAKSAADAGDNIAKTADKIGISTDALQEYRFAAERSGVSTLTMDSALTRLNKRLGDAKNGVGTAVVGFKQLSGALGKQVKFTGTLDEQFEQLVDGLKKVPDEAKRVSIAEQFLGEQGRQLANVINLGADGLKNLRQEARSLGGILDEETARAAEKFTDQMFDLEFVLTGVKNIVGASLFPVLGDLIDQFKDFVKQNQNLIKTKITSFFQTLVKFVKNFVGLMKIMFGFLSNIVSLFGDWERAIRFVTIAMIGLLGAQMLLALGNMALLVVKIVKSIQLMGNAALIAKAKLLAIPILIGAALVALGLIIEDIVAFFNGEKSVTGLIVKEFNEMFATLDDKFKAFGGKMKFFANLILTPFRVMINTIRTAGSLLGVIAGGGGIGDAFSAVKEGFADTFRPLTEFDAGEGSLQSSLGFGKSSPGTTSSSNTSNATSIENNISVQVPDGLSPEAAAEATQAGVKDALSGLLRETSRQVSTPIAE